MQHVGQKLLKGKVVTDEASQRQHFDLLLLMKHADAPCIGIQMQDDVLAYQFGRDVVPFEINTHHAMPIHLALQVQAIQRLELLIWVYDRRKRW